MFLIQRIYKGAGEDGKDIRETLMQNLGDPDRALDKIKEYFDEKEEFNITYNSATKRFSVIPESRKDLLYHIVRKNEEAVIDETGEDTINE